jgi:hypothetical protein
MVCAPCFPSVILLVVLGVVDLEERVYLHILSNYPCRSTASGPVKLTFSSLILTLMELIFNIQLLSVVCVRDIMANRRRTKHVKEKQRILCL